MKQKINNINVKCVMPRMTNDIAIIILNMSALEKQKQYIFSVPCFICMYFFIAPNWPKIGIFLGLGFSSTFGPPPPPQPSSRHIFPGVPPLGTFHCLYCQVVRL